VIKFEREGNYAPLYVRLYVVEPIISTLGGVMGAKVKCQFPFIINNALSVSKDLLSFTKESGIQTVTITTDASTWAYSCDIS